MAKKKEQYYLDYNGHIWKLIKVNDKCLVLEDDNFRMTLTPGKGSPNPKVFLGMVAILIEEIEVPSKKKASKVRRQ